MLVPIAHADPTELIPALAALHVVASLIFLDWSLALGTRFCVSHEPESIFRLCTLFFDPDSEGFTVAGAVAHFAAVKAEFSAAIAKNFWEKSCFIHSFTRELTTSIWAPLYIRILVGQRLD